MSERALVTLLAKALGIESAGLGANLVTINTAQVGRPSDISICTLLVMIWRSARWVHALELSIATFVLAVTAVLTVVMTLTVIRVLLLLTLIWYLTCSQGHYVFHVVGITRIGSLIRGGLDLVSLSRLLGR